MNNSGTPQGGSGFQREGLVQITRVGGLLVRPNLCQSYDWARHLLHSSGGPLTAGVLSCGLGVAQPPGIDIFVTGDERLSLCCTPLCL